MSIEGFAIVYLCAALINLTSAGMLAGLAPGTTVRNALWIYATGLALTGSAMLTIALRVPWGLPESGWLPTNLCFWSGALLLWLAIYRLFERPAPWRVFALVGGIGALLLLLLDGEPRWRGLRNLLVLGGLFTSMLGRAWLALRHHQPGERTPALAMAALLVVNAMVMVVALTSLQRWPQWVAPVGLSALTAAIVSVLVLVALLAMVNRRMQRFLRELADRDSLTRALTRRAFFEHAGDRFRADAARADWIAMLDFDHFKRINDVHGHVAGDAVLEAGIAALRARLPAAALLGRYGGEEFALLWPADAPPAADALEALRRAVGAAASSALGERTSVSIGLARRQPGEDLSATIARADAALYAAKQQGRDALRHAA